MKSLLTPPINYEQLENWRKVMDCNYEYNMDIIVQGSTYICKYICSKCGHKKEESSENPTFTLK